MSNNWKSVKEVFFAVLEEEITNRDNRLEELCANNETLRKEVESLLVAHNNASSFIENKAIEDVAHLLIDQEEVELPKNIGVYEVVSKIGQGGMGLVYLAKRADKEYEKNVAIKIVKHKFVDDFVSKQFLKERQILANLDHPNITKLLDGGRTEEGLPYLVMEYVEGETINSYCDNHKLTIKERLKLFRQVCSAVQYAHQRLIIHRDIKPSNILVTKEGTPKLLDFGIAKLFNSEISQDNPTFTDVRALTPYYASPEQIQGKFTDITTDVYSLGVVLYELLTGHRPYNVASNLPHEIEKAVCEQEPEKPSVVINQSTEVKLTNKTFTITPDLVSQNRRTTFDKLKKDLVSDLDNLLLKALRKEKDSRYKTVAQLDEDIYNYLKGLPINAKNDSFFYRSSKFIKRNKLAVALASFSIFTLITGTVIASWQAYVANYQKARAEKRFNDVRKLASSFLFEFNDKITPLPGSTSARQLIVEKAFLYLNSLAEEANNDKDLQLELIIAYQKLGDIQGNLYFDNAGDSSKAASSYYKALELSESLVRKYPTDELLTKVLSDSNCKVGEMLMFTSNLVAAKDYYKKGLDMLVKIAKIFPDSEVKYELPMRHLKMGDIYSLNGNNDLALESYKQAVISAKKLFADEPTKADIRVTLVTCSNRFAGQIASTGDPLQALEVFDKSAKICQQWLAIEPTNEQAYQLLLSVYKNTSPILVRLGNTQRAIKYSQEVLEEAAKRSQIDSNNANRRRNLMAFYADLAFAQAAAKEIDDAIKNYRSALSIQEELLAKDSQNSRFRRDLGYIYSCLGELFIENNPKEALQGYIKAKNLFEELLKEDASNVLVQADLSRVLFMIAKLQVKLDNITEATDLTTRALEMQKSLANAPQALTSEINNYAKYLITCEPQELRDPTTALKYSQRAANLTNYNDPDILTTLSQVYAFLDDQATSIKFAKKASDLIAIAKN